EPQHAPTEADVDAMIAATAAALMASDGSIETTEQSVDAGMAAPSFEIVDDQGAQQQDEAEGEGEGDDDEGAEDAVDLTAELNDLPAVQEVVSHAPASVPVPQLATLATTTTSTEEAQPIVASDPYFHPIEALAPTEEPPHVQQSSEPEPDLASVQSIEVQQFAAPHTR